MELSIAAHNIEVKLVTIRKHIQYAIDDLLEVPSDSEDILQRLLNRMDVGTNDPDSVVPNRISGDLSLVDELKYLNSIVLTTKENYHV